MNKLKILFKNNLNIFIGGFQGKKKRKNGVAITLIVFLALLILASYSLQTYQMFDGLGSLGLNNLVMFHGIITTLTVLVILGVMRSTADVKHSDNDLLLSLPLTKKEIIISKTFNKYFYDFVFTFLLLIPYIVIYQIKTSFSISITLLGLLSIVILPLTSIGISYICDFIINRIFNKSRFGKLWKSLFTILIFVGVLALMLLKTFGYGNVQATSMEEYFSDRPISYALLRFILNTDIISVLVIFAITFVPITIGIILYSLNFGKSFSKYDYSKIKSTYKKTTLFSTLYLKEIKNYFTTPAYVINTIIGPILILILSITLAIVGADKINEVTLGMFNGDMLSAIALLAFLGLSSMTTISSPSISLESKNLWIIKHLPISATNLFLSKSILHLTIMLIPATISSIILALFTPINLVYILIIYTINLLHISTLAFGGLFINLIYPMLEWSDPTKPVKAGISTLLGILLGFTMTAIPVGLHFIFKSLSYMYIGIITLPIYACILTIFIYLLFTKGEKLFNKL